MRIHCIIQISLLMILGLSGHAQVMEFGYVDPAYFQDKDYPEGAEEKGAVIVGETGHVSVVYENDNFIMVYTVHTQIKILNEKGFRFADKQLYEFKPNNRRIVKIRGWTHNSTDGVMTKVKLEKDAVFESKFTSDVTFKTFTMPSVRKGSVIEYEYTIRDEAISTLEDWYFQHNIPILYSKFTAEFPVWFRYLIISKNRKKLKYTLSTKSDFIGSGPVAINSHTWIAHYLPSIRPEPYVEKVTDYIPSVSFELASFTPPYSEEKQYFKKWDKQGEDLMQNSYFGSRWRGMGFAKDDLQDLIADKASQLEKAKAIYHFIQNSIEWNGQESMYASESLKKSYETKEGNSAEINMILLGLLEDAEISALPVILSTRENGRLPSDDPILSWYNYMIVQVEIDGQKYLLDATAKGIPFGALPIRCSNGKGRLIRSRFTEWVDLTGYADFKMTRLTSLQLQKDGRMIGTVSTMYSDIAAFSLRNRIQRQGKEEYIKNLERSYEDAKISQVQFENLDLLDKSLKITYHIETEPVMGTLDLMYINPLIALGSSTNPFKNKDRQYPIDFPYTKDITYIFTLTYPMDYQVEEMPQVGKLNFDDGICSYTYLTKSMDQNIQLVSKEIMSQTFFETNAYEPLRDYIISTADIEKQFIVLSKK